MVRLDQFHCPGSGYSTDSISCSIRMGRVECVEDCERRKVRTEHVISVPARPEPPANVEQDEALEEKNGGGIDFDSFFEAEGFRHGD